MVKIGFIGAGMVGAALAIGLKDNGYSVVAVSSRTFSSADKLARMVPGAQVYRQAQQVANVASLVFITTPDDAIAKVASDLRWHHDQAVVHCSGALSSAILRPAVDMGAKAGSFHPLQTFAGIGEAIENLPGSTFALEAGEPLLSTLKEMVAALGGCHIELSAEDKVVYHAAAVITSNYLVTLVKMATELWQTFNVPANETTRALAPLLRGTLNNIETTGIPQCLTGPVARGDTGTIKKHLRALQKVAPELLVAYRELGLRTVPVALAKGTVDQSKAENMANILRTTKL
jgi:predicted short-subunit dehydrogenase-like oxidoreductase (DUF2520 family)